MRSKRTARPPIPTLPSDPLRWGDGSLAYPPAGIRAIEEYFERELGPATPPTSPSRERPPAAGPSRLTPADVEGLRARVSGPVSIEELDRVCYSFGRSYGELVAWRDRPSVPTTDAVVWPATPAEVQAVLAFASDNDLAVVPWGGGTSLVGGVAPLAGTHRAVITLCLGRVSRPLGIDPRTDSARFEAGAHGPDIERFLGERGVTFAHYPLSFEFSTLGGWISTDSSSQSSSRYGEILDRVTSARWATPTGFYEWKAGEAGPGGIEPRRLLASEGTLGVLVDAGVRLAPAPEKSAVRAVLLPSWAPALGVLRALVADDPRPAIARMSDPEESRFLLTLARGGSPPEEIGGLEGIALRRKIADLSAIVLGIVSFDGSRKNVGRGTYVLEELARQAGGAVLPGGVWPGFGEAWARTRFRAPALRDGLVPDGWVLEGIEATVPWEQAAEIASPVREAVRSAASEFGARARLHLQAGSPTSSTVTLTCTVIYPEPAGRALEAWNAMRAAASAALVEHGAILAQRPGIGRLDRSALGFGLSPAERAEMLAFKATIDPKGVLNPGKFLIP
ncbi:MAG TPA: FAD-binding oxidoreductase [Thermoplasmata archaeon]|nr:FAD-binding oxidoreductase [Thermoplasmata archaeon]